MSSLVTVARTGSDQWHCSKTSQLPGCIVPGFSASFRFKDDKRLWLANLAWNMNLPCQWQKKRKKNTCLIVFKFNINAANVVNSTLDAESLLGAFQRCPGWELLNSSLTCHSRNQLRLPCYAPHYGGNSWGKKKKHDFQALCALISIQFHLQCFLSMSKTSEPSNQRRLVHGTCQDKNGWNGSNQHLLQMSQCFWRQSQGGFW